MYSEDMAEGCIFCQIIEGKKSADTVYEDDDFVAFYDVRPSAPVHILIVPRKHFEWQGNLSDKREMLGKIFEIAPKIAEKLDVKNSGYKLVMNCGSGAGQIVKHFHIHLIGGWGDEGVVVEV